jgi:prolyl 4-hydroxylase
VPPAPAGLPGSDPRLLAEIGSKVRARLDSEAAAERIAAAGIDMYVVRDFLSGSECARFVAMIDADVEPSQILRSSSDPDFRTSETCVLERSVPEVAEVEHRIADLLGLPIEGSETLQGQRYLPGQQFKAHNDYFVGGKSYSAAVAEEGGQRTWTAMVFLDEPKSGGSTNFVRAGVAISPRAGTLLAWNNLDTEGRPNPLTRHQGSLVEEGVKHVLTKWFRERPYRRSETTAKLGS